MDNVTVWGIWDEDAYPFYTKVGLGGGKFRWKSKAGWYRTHHGLYWTLDRAKAEEVVEDRKFGCEIQVMPDDIVATIPEAVRAVVGLLNMQRADRKLTIANYPPPWGCSCAS